MSTSSSIKKLAKACFVIWMFILIPGVAQAATYYVSANGNAAWASATNSSTPCSLATANSSAVAGDVIVLSGSGGVYGTAISPANSGSAGRMITYQAAAGQTPTFTGNFFTISLVGKSYIKVTGIKATGVNMFYFIGYGASYNEIANCTFTTPNSTYYSLALIINTNAGFTGNVPSHNNWIHHNSFSRYGAISGCDDKGTIRIGQAGDGSHHNTIENNVFSNGGHDLLDIGGKYNVVRNNVFHNEESYFRSSACTNSPSSGYFGNRNIILTGYSVLTTDFNLIEGNRSGYAGTPPDDDGSFGIENGGMHTLVRYNNLYGNGGAGYYTKSQGVEHGQLSHIYNNTIFSNGHGDADLQTIYKGGIVIACSGSSGTPFNALKNNIVYGNSSDSIKYVGQNCLPSCDIANNLTANPLFVNASMADKASLTLPDLRLQAGSPAVNAGTNLTQAVGAGSNSTTLTVSDAGYFQDGWGSGLATRQADWIAIGTVDNVVQIRSINYSNNTITLAAPKTWAANAKIWLYKKSDGAVVLSGPAPDAGAHEYGSPGGLVPNTDPSSPTRPEPPRNLRLQ